MIYHRDWKGYQPLGSPLDETERKQAKRGRQSTEIPSNAACMKTISEKFIHIIHAASKLENFPYTALGLMALISLFSRLLLITR